MGTDSVSPSWEFVGSPGTQVLRVWQLEGKDKYPHVALLRVPNDTYQGFAQKPTSLVDFLNANAIFPDKVNGTGPWVALSSFNNTVSVPGYILTMVHQKTSLAAVTAHPNVSGE
jgi:hypothetical protein